MVPEGRMDDGLFDLRFAKQVSWPVGSLRWWVISILR